MSFKVGDKVLVKKNVWDKKELNNKIGKIVKMSSDKRECIIEFRESMKFCHDGCRYYIDGVADIVGKDGYCWGFIISGGNDIIELVGDKQLEFAF